MCLFNDDGLAIDTIGATALAVLARFKTRRAPIRPLI
jgi:hypothetical protein